MLKASSTNLGTATTRDQTRNNYSTGLFILSHWILCLGSFNTKSFYFEKKQERTAGLKQNKMNEVTTERDKEERRRQTSASLLLWALLSQQPIRRLSVTMPAIWFGNAYGVFASEKDMRVCVRERGREAYSRLPVRLRGCPEWKVSTWAVSSAAHSVLSGCVCVCGLVQMRLDRKLICISSSDAAWFHPPSMCPRGSTGNYFVCRKKQLLKWGQKKEEGMRHRRIQQSVLSAQTQKWQAWLR